MGIMYHLKELEADELNLIATALSKLPFESVAPLIAKLKSQVQSIEAELTAEKAAAQAKAAAVTDPSHTHAPQTSATAPPQTSATAPASAVPPTTPAATPSK